MIRRHSTTPWFHSVLLAALVSAGRGLAAPPSTPTPAPGNALIRPVAIVKYLSPSAAAPLRYIELIVEEDGGLSTGLMPQTPRCRKLPLSQVTDIAALLRTEAFRAAIQGAQVKSFASALPDPSLLVFVNHTPYFFPASSVPAPVRALIAAVDKAFSTSTCQHPPPAISPHLGSH